MNYFFKTIALALGLTLLSPALAHGDKDHAQHSVSVKREQKAWGIAGNPKQVSRTIEVGMTDNMRFTPNTLDIKRGETIRFKIANKGKIMHEFVIGTKAELEAHAALMLKHPNMEHDEPYMAHVGPGKTGELIWTFNRAGHFEFACLIAGHFQAGMVGKITVR